MRYDPDLVLTEASRPDVLAYLHGRGVPAATLAVMSGVQLVNAYHEWGGSETVDARQVAAEAVIATLAALQYSGFDPATIRAIIREEAERVAPQRLEVITERSSVVLDGAIHYKTGTIIRVAAIGQPVMMVGPAGCGKTTIGEHVAQSLALPFYITNTVTDTHELLGFVDGHGNYHGTPFRQAFEYGGVWIADEIDAWESGPLLAANSALANGYTMFPDRREPVRRHPDFRMIATANTFGTGADRVYVGRNELDAASLDRFATIEVDYDLDLERMFAGPHDRWLEHVWKVRKAVASKKIRHVVSSRAIRMGADGLSIGLSWDECEEFYLYKGMSSRDREKLK